ncbi:MAG: phosphotransferase [Jiangellaceae bacterium]|nr:phosphotransferase [Jiangellaceae bacterium]
MRLAEQIETQFGLVDPRCNRVDTLVNDVIAVTTSSDRFALKLYNFQTRAAREVQWELDLIAHLVRHGAPVVKPIRGRHAYMESFVVDGRERVAVLYEWAPGEKPTPGQDTYALLGKAAAQIHTAADTFNPSWLRDDYDAQLLIDEQLRRIRAHLVAIRRWTQTQALVERLKRCTANHSLDQGICHMDLTLDNVHREGATITVFDFDSAGKCWRSIEPYGVLKFSREYFQAWVEGYRSVRHFSYDDEKAVAAFCIIGDLRVVAWKLGVARSSHGEPLLTAADMQGVVDEWLEWETNSISNS